VFTAKAVVALVEMLATDIPVKAVLVALMVLVVMAVHTVGVEMVTAVPVAGPQSVLSGPVTLANFHQLVLEHLNFLEKS
jgi:hypothetical protein